MMRRLVMACVVMAAMVASGREAEAAGCSVSVSPIVFGTYDVFAPAPLDSVATVVYNCNGEINLMAITISAGQGGGFAPRKSFSGTEWLGYNLYRDPSRAIVWGNGTGGTSLHVVRDVAKNIDVNVPVYGRIDPGQDVRAGSYADNVSVTVNF